MSDRKYARVAGGDTAMSSLRRVPSADDDEPSQTRPSVSGYGGRRGGGGDDDRLNSRVSGKYDGDGPEYSTVHSRSTAAAAAGHTTDATSLGLGLGMGPGLGLGLGLGLGRSDRRHHGGGGGDGSDHDQDGRHHHHGHDDPPLDIPSIVRRVAGGERTGPHYLHTIPDDSLYAVCSYLDVQSVVALSNMDTRMRDVLNGHDDVWRLKAMTDYTHLTLEERRAAAHWTNPPPRAKYVALRQRRYQSRLNARFERARQADRHASERDALTRRLPFHYFAESGFTLTAPAFLCLFAFLLSRSDSESVTAWWVAVPLLILQLLAFGLLFFLWGHDARSYEADHGLCSTCLGSLFSDAPPLARKYTWAACANGCLLLATVFVCTKLSGDGATHAQQDTSYGWGATFAPLWVLFFLLALPMAWNERSTLNWRALWMALVLPALLSTILLVVRLDRHASVSLAQAFIPWWLSLAFVGFVTLRVSLRFGCHVLWRGVHCVLVADPYADDLGPDRDILDVIQQNEQQHDAADWHSPSISLTPELGHDTSARCMCWSAQGATAVAAVLSYGCVVVWHILLCVRAAQVDAAAGDTNGADGRSVMSMRAVCTPLLIACALIWAICVRYARLQFAHRSATYQYQMERPLGADELAAV